MTRPATNVCAECARSGVAAILVGGLLAWLRRDDGGKSPCRMCALPSFHRASTRLSPTWPCLRASKVTPPRTNTSTLAGRSRLFEGG